MVMAEFDAGRLARRQGDTAVAIAHFQAALKHQPNHLPSLNNLANALQAQGDTDAAMQMYERALKIAPNKGVLHCNMGSLWQIKGEPERAMACFERATALQPDFVLAHHNLAKLAMQQGKYPQAEGAFRQALQLKPQQADLHLDYGDLCQNSGHFTRAVRHYREALRLEPSARGYNSLGTVLQHYGNPELARKSYLRALKMEPEFKLPAYNLAQLDDYLGSFDSARAYYEKTLIEDPNDARLHLQLATLRRKQADWANEAVYQEALERSLQHYLTLEKPDPLPLLSALALPVDADLLLPLAERTAAYFKRQAAALGVTFSHSMPSVPPQRLKVGYLSPDFRCHAVGTLLAGLFQHHSRPDFEIFAYSLTPMSDPWTERVRQGCDHFEDVSTKAAQDIARRIYADGIHILVDLAGYTTHSRTLVAALKPAPVQVQYMGYPGTLGADFLPHILADAHLVPPTHVDRYSENVIRLPNAWAAEPMHVADTTWSRSELGLPEQGMVYCCFNGIQKIDPAVFALWMQILHAVPDSVLWLLDGGKNGSNQRLQQAAQEAGIAPQRLVFATKRDHAEYLALYRMADLFLDTPAYNAGATAVGALSAGLPLLSCPGEHYVTRMGASLLHAVGLPDLVCTDAAAYVAQAVALGHSPQACAELKARLAHNLPSAPLFQPQRFVTALEDAYRHLWGQWCTQTSTESTL